MVEQLRSYWAIHGTFCGVEDYLCREGKSLSDDEIKTVCASAMPSFMTDEDLFREVKPLDNKTEGALLLLHYLFNGAEITLGDRVIAFNKLFWITLSGDKNFNDSWCHITTRQLLKEAAAVIKGVVIEHSTDNVLHDGKLFSRCQKKSFDGIRDLATVMYTAMQRVCKGMMSPYTMFLTIFNKSSKKSDEIFRLPMQFGITVNAVLSLFGLKVPSLFEMQYKYGIPFLNLDDYLYFIFGKNGELSQVSKEELLCQLKTIKAAEVTG